MQLRIKTRWWPSSPRTRPLAVAAALALLGLLTVSLTLRLFYPQQTAIEHLRSGRTGPVEMPWQFWEVTHGNVLQLRLDVNCLTSRAWNIVPDDHLAALNINGRPVPLDQVRPGGLNDWRNGFEIDLSPWLQNGGNELEFIVDNYLGVGGIVFRPLLGWRFILVSAAFLPWLLLLSRAFRLSRVQTLILCGCLVVLCCYWSATPWTARNYDVKRLGETGHLDYVAIVARTLALPRPDRGWEFFQPPLYYVAAALAWRWADWLNLSLPEALQAFALALWLVFLVASAATLRLALQRSRRAQAAVTAAVGLWPGGIINSVRIGNDPALYAAAAVAGWFMFRWWRSGRRNHLLYTAGAITVALLCKSNAIVLAAAFGVLLGLRLLSSHRRLRRLADLALAAAVVAAGMLLSLARNVYYWWHGQLASFVNPSAIVLDANLRVPNLLRYYLPLDVPVFLSAPWVDSRNDATGRSNYWNYLLRSSLSGEFAFDGSLQRDIAIFWGVALLWLVLLLAARSVEHPPSLKAAWRDMPLLMLAALWLLSSLGLRLMHPFSSHQDFRLVYPLLVPFVFFCVRQGPVAEGLLWAIALGSVVFFVGL